MGDVSDLPEKMDVAVYRGPGELTVERRTVPRPAGHEVVVAVDRCGVCGTDLHSVLEGWGIPGSVPGHEWSGEVAAVGPDVERWAPGDRVIGVAPPGCGECQYCRADKPILCESHGTPGTAASQGAFAEYVKSTERELLAVPSGLSLRDAALAEPLAVALHAITNSGIGPSESALVSGAGPIGSLILAALVARGYEHLAVVEPSEARAELAAEIGAERVLDPSELEVPSIAEPGRIVEDAVDVVFETSGKRRAMEAGLAQLRKTGRLLIVGSGMEPPAFDSNRILLNELLVSGSFCYDTTGFADALELLASGRLPTQLLIDPVDVPLDGVLGALHGLARGEIAGKALVRPSLEEERSDA